MTAVTEDTIEFTPHDRVAEWYHYLYLTAIMITSVRSAISENIEFYTAVVYLLIMMVLSYSGLYIYKRFDKWLTGFDYGMISNLEPDTTVKYILLGIGFLIVSSLTHVGWQVIFAANSLLCLLIILDWYLLRQQSTEFDITGYIHSFAVLVGGVLWLGFYFRYRASERVEAIYGKTTREVAKDSELF